MTMRWMKVMFGLGVVVLMPMVMLGQSTPKGSVRVYPSPVGEPLSKRFTVSVEGKDAPVYVAHVCSLLSEKPDVYQQGEAGFASFDIDGTVRVTVTATEKVKTVKILPSSYGIVAKIAGDAVTFTVSKPGQITVEVNGDWNNSLHVFANAFEDAPNLKDPNLIYFGPGRHEIESMHVGSGKTVYIAGGAVIYGKLTSGHVHEPVFSLVGENITLRGRGIIDGSLHVKATAQANMIYAKGEAIEIEGVTLRDSSSWNVPIRQSTNVKVRNIKVFGWQLNSDGVDVVNSQNVDVSDSFLRSFDDLIVVKTSLKGGGISKDVTAERLVLWNEKAHALTVGAELREDAVDTVFSDCDIIHDKGHDWLLRVFNGDSGTVRHLVYDNIRIEEDRRPFSLFIGKTNWSKDEERGHIEDVVFRNIQSPVPEWNHPTQLVGVDAAHEVQGVLFDHVTFGGKPMKAGDVEKNEFVEDVVVKP